MAKIYEVILHVAEETLSPLIGAVAPQCTIVQVKPKEATTQPAPTKRKYYVDGKRFKGISGEDLLLQTLAVEKRAYSTVELEAVFVAKQFKANSLSPILSRLMAGKKIKRVKPGHYVLA